jgi:surface antigen
VRCVYKYYNINKTICLKCNSAFRIDTFCHRLSLCFVLVASVSACSVTTPIASLMPDDQIETGSLPSSQTIFVDRLTSEDWRRARSALGLALDPQSTGTAVKWDNPESKTNGSFVAAGGFVVRNDFVCRPFQASLSVRGTQSNPSGFACRQGPSDWVIEQPAIVEKTNKKLQPGELF